MSQADAVANVRALRPRLRFLAEDDRVATRLLDLLDKSACSGAPVHDANLVAVMLTHGIDTLVTMNIGDFHRFDDLITVISLNSVS